MTRLEAELEERLAAAIGELEHARELAMRLEEELYYRLPSFTIEGSGVAHTIDEPRVVHGWPI